MKNKIYIILLVMLCSFSSCSDYLDRAPTADLDNEAVFSEMRLARMYHNALYEHVQAGTQEFQGIVGAVGNTTRGWAILSELDGYFIQGRSWAHVNVMLQGSWGLGSTDDNSGWNDALCINWKWARLYTAIRACNIFLEGIPNMPESETAADPTEVPVMIAEAKALRGFFYLQLVQRWGGVPIVDKVLDVSDDLRLPRNTMQECLDFIVNDFEEAAEVLGLEPRGGMATWGGRITKGAALAFRARAILWGASQYWSANGVNYTWQQAADACQDVIALNKYSLHQDFRTTLFDPDAFGTEIIFWHNQGYYQGFNFVNLVHTVFGGTTSPGIQLPTYEFVKCYEILDEATGKYVPFDEKNSDHMENLINPDRRDPRFAASVLYNGATHQGKVCGLYTGGNLWSSSIYYTGYQYKRWYSEDQITGGGGSGTTLQNWAFIRYTDILLMYAEAQNQASGMNSSASGATMTALEAYNAVRLRSGLTALEESDFTSDYTFDDRIRNERSVEFPCEDIRFFDIRRWDIGNVAWVTPHGSDATANSDGTYTYDYSREIGTKRTPFANTHQAVLYPFHHTELTRNPNLVQNPGWTDIYRN